MNYHFLPKDRDKAYITNNLALPKHGVNLAPVMTALTFVYGEEEIHDELGELVMVRPAELRLWQETRHHLIVPREFLNPRQYPQFGFEFIDQRPTEFPHVDIEDRVDFRDEGQREAFRIMEANQSGTVNLACGKGKTFLALKLAARLQVPTMIVVNSTALLEQWKLEIEKFLGIGRVGVIQGPVADWEHPIVLAMVHTLSKHRESWSMRFRKRFGLIFYDEGHHMSAPHFVRSADLFFGRRYSLTATATRIDGLEAIYQYHLGGVIHRNLEQELIPTTYFHRLKWEFDLRNKPFVTDSNGDFNLPRIRTYLGELDWRNQIIYRDLLSDIQEGRQILVLSHSVEHVDRIHQCFARSGLRAGTITGATPQEERMGALSQCNPVIGTFQLAREGLNKPSLDTLYVTTPFSSPNDLQQAWGRIQRVYPGKQPPLVRVYEDLPFKMCRGSCSSLRSHLKKIDYPFHKREVEIPDEQVQQHGRNSVPVR